MADDERDDESNVDPTGYEPPLLVSVGSFDEHTQGGFGPYLEGGGYWP